MKNVWAEVWRLIRKFLSLKVILAVIFIIIMVFIDEHSFLQRVAYNRKIKQLKSEIEAYQQKIDECKYRLNELRSNEENLEKFAREEYLMRKPNEDIYLIREE